MHFQQTAALVTPGQRSSPAVHLSYQNLCQHESDACFILYHGCNVSIGLPRQMLKTHGAIELHVGLVALGREFSATLTLYGREELTMLRTARCRTGILGCMKGKKNSSSTA